MNKIMDSSSEPWYWFIPSILKCDHATSIRCFLAPIYLPYISNVSDIEIIKSQKQWLDFYEEKVTTYTFDDRTIVSDKIVKQRLKLIGTGLCESVLIESKIECNKYLGKNRNILNYPERFICAVFPDNSSKGIFEELWSYYFNLLVQVLGKDETYVIKILSDLESINQNTAFFHVPEIVSQSNDFILKKIDRIAHLLCSFCVLSSAFSVCENPKNGDRPYLRSNLFHKAQTYLEIPVNNTMNFLQSGEITMTYNDLFELNVNAIAVKKIELLQLVYSVNKKNTDSLSLPGKDSIRIKNLINSIKDTQLQLINRMNCQLYDIGKGAAELLFLSNLEKFWQEIYNLQ